MELYNWIHYYYLDPVPEWLRAVPIPRPLTDVLCTLAQRSLILTLAILIFISFLPRRMLRFRILRLIKEKLIWTQKCMEYWVIRQFIPNYEFQTPESEDDAEQVHASTSENSSDN